MERIPLSAEIAMVSDFIEQLKQQKRGRSAEESATMDTLIQLLGNTRDQLLSQQKAEAEATNARTERAVKSGSKVFDDKMDKHLAAIHEAAHVTVALATGINATAYLQKSNSADLVRNKGWVGRTILPGQVTPVIAVAGLVAECRDLAIRDGREIDEVALADETYESLFVEGASPTDISAIPVNDADAAMAAITHALQLLERHSAFLEWAAEQLERNEVISEGRAKEQFLQHLRDLAKASPGRPDEEPQHDRSGDPQRLLKEREAAGWLGIGQRTLRRLVEQGQMPVVRIGHLVRYDPADLKAYIERQKEHGPRHGG